MELRSHRLHPWLKQDNKQKNTQEKTENSPPFRNVGAEGIICSFQGKAGKFRITWTIKYLLKLHSYVTKLTSLPTEEETDPQNNMPQVIRNLTASQSQEIIEKTYPKNLATSPTW